MQINLEKILSHANEKLAAAGQASDHEARVDIFRRFLKVESERLRIRHRFGLGGGEIASGRCYLIDVIVCRACHLAAAETGASEADLGNLVVVALGGYGRRELAPFSDIDILFLHAGRRSKGSREFVEQVLYLLWDVGLTVGHCFRSVSECIEMAQSDLHSRNAMADARLIIGNVHMFRRLNREMDDALSKNRRQVDAFIEEMRLEREARYDRFGRTVCMLEPNVKESAGGLRDLHTALWIGRAVFGAKGLDDLRAEDIISGMEYATVRRAYDFILRVRNEAHFSTGRRTDLLTLDLQPTAASNLGYTPRRGLLASELMMLDYYQQAKEVHQFLENFLLRAMEFRSDRRRPRNRAGAFRASFVMKAGKLYLTIARGAEKRNSKASSFEIKQDKLYLGREPADFRSNPMRTMEVFLVAQAEGVEISNELKLAVRGNLSLVGRRFRASKEAAHAFVEMLRRKGRVAMALRAMYETGFLGRLLPEFARITFLVQHDSYHKYTIDEHTLKAVEALDHLASHQDEKLSRFGKALSEVEDPAPLYLGLLLHDIGKGRGKGHVARGVQIAERVCERLGLSCEMAEAVVFLVRHHLLMSHLSQRRDITDEDLLEGFVATVGSLDRLNMLFVLTYADMNAVGPGVWNDWKGGLLWELYTRARSHLTGGRPVRWDADRKSGVMRQAMEELLPDYAESDIRRHFAMMPERYIRATDPRRMARHFRLVSRMGDGPAAFDWQEAEGEQCAELTVCSRDSHGLFARLAGTLTACGINILGADLYTREDGIVIDRFKVCEISGQHGVRPERWPGVEASLKKAVAEGYDVEAAVERWRAKRVLRPKRRAAAARSKPTVRFDSASSAASTIIEVRAEDEPGLAYRIASAITALGLNISLAKIATEKNQALDVFYVTDSTGRKLAPGELPAVEAALLEALARGEDAISIKEAV